MIDVAVQFFAGGLPFHARHNLGKKSIMALEGP